MSRPPQTRGASRRTPPQTGLFPGEGGVLVGTVERIRFRAEDTGYTVLLVQPEDENAARVAAVGYLSGIREGERVRFEGAWKEHPRFGRQFQVASAQPLVPTTAEGIEKYLASGIVKNIGPALAKRIVARFGEQTLDIIDTQPQRLLEIPGLGAKKLAEVVDSWKSQSEVKEIMLFLQQHDIPLHLSEKILRAYGANAIQTVRDNPYRLATDIYGVGFRTADRIAQRMGIPSDDPARCQAGALYILNQLAERDGHVFVPSDVLVEEASGMLGVETGQVESAVEEMRRNESVVTEPLEGREKTGSAVYPRPLHAAESEVARRLAVLSRTSRDEARLGAALRGEGLPGDALPDRLRAFAQRALEGGKATGDQGRAIEGALTNKVLVVTGGPGTGKTTIISAVTKLYRQLGLQLLLGAPTGRAAKRLAEVTGHAASTVHRMLEFSWVSGGFTRDASTPLLADCVIIDEASMMDMNLMAHLLRAVPDTSGFVLVGDVDQLPSVGPGNVLRDVIESDALPVVRLKEVFRQSKESLIVENAHRVNRGEMPRENKSQSGRESTDYYFIEENDPERCADIVVELCRERIPQRFGLNPISDIQVISPMQRGTLGVQSLNARLQEALNPQNRTAFLQSGGRTFRLGDKLIQVRNNYEKNVFNGDIGIVQKANQEEGIIRVSFDTETVDYKTGELDELTHAYAVTVHKSQGSEYPAVVIPLHTQHYPMLQRNLVYTALTRARQLAIFVGSRKALAIAVNNAQVRRRWSRLTHRLRKETGLAEDVEETLPEHGAAVVPPGDVEPASEEQPPDALYETEAEEKPGEGDSFSGELSYHPVEE